MSMRVARLKQQIISIKHFSSTVNVQARAAGPSTVPPPLPPVATADPSRLELLLQSARLTHIGHDIWSQVLRCGDTVVDATCGNGNDTLFLASSTGPQGTVYAFDLQKEAINNTKLVIESEILVENRPEMHYVEGCHSTMQDVVGSLQARLVCFNLGYLPGADKKSTVTAIDSTLNAVEASFEVLLPGGLLSVLSYTGHPGGYEEYQAVSNALQHLPTEYWVSSEIKLLNRPTAPILLLAWKRQHVNGM